jgi:hypothetical protein
LLFQPGIMSAGEDARPSGVVVMPLALWYTKDSILKYPSTRLAL